MFAITDEFELLALHGALIEAKLPRASEDQELSASPLVARLAERATEACRALPEHLWPRDEAWRKLSPRHARWAPAVARALSDQAYLRRATLPERREYVRLLLAPYHNDDADVSNFLEHVESIIRERSWYHLWLRRTSPFAGGVAFLTEVPDGRFVAWDANHREIASGSLDEVGAVLLEGGFEPFRYFVQDVPDAGGGDVPPSSSSPPWHDGRHARTGQRTDVLNLCRTETGLIHGAPGSPQ